jgi:hypothetical protein
VIKGPKDIVIILLALICIGVSIMMQPWAELGFSGNFPAWLSCIAQPTGVSELFTNLGKSNFAHDIQQYLSDQGAKANFGDYAYVLFMFVAMIVAAIAIVLIGVEDAEEKTVLPVKK